MEQREITNTVAIANSAQLTPPGASFRQLHGHIYSRTFCISPTLLLSLSS